METPGRGRGRRGSFRPIFTASRRVASLALVSMGAASAAGCGTGGASAGGDRDLPNASAGPFRLLRKGETSRPAPFVVTDVFRSPAVVDLDGDPSTPAAALYVATVSAPRRIFRYELADGRTASKTRVEVLAAGEGPEATEGVDHPMPLRVGSEIWLYFSSVGCVRRAVSRDGGLTFERDVVPILCGGDGVAPWESGWVGAPSVHAEADGAYRMFYESDGGIGEARSVDGVAFTRVGAGPVLTPSRGPVGAGTSLARAAGASGGGGADPAADEPFDGDRVGEPMALGVEGALGRPITLLYYAARSASGRWAVGLAARFGDEGAFERNPVPALARHDARSPFVVRVGGVSLMFAEGRSSEASANWKPNILGAVAPATASVPLPVSSVSGP